MQMQVNEKAWTQIQLDQLFARYATLLRRIELLEEAGADVRAEGFLAGVSYERHADDEAYDDGTPGEGYDKRKDTPDDVVETLRADRDTLITYLQRTRDAVWATGLNEVLGRYNEDHAKDATNG